jgi:hypothetical protein
VRGNRIFYSRRAVSFDRHDADPGRLVMVIGPYDRLTTVTCSYATAQQSGLDGICQTVAASVVIR